MPPPNILFILIDDLGWRDLGCYGSTFYETPCIDHLAREGITFTNAYAACPVCSPTRASIMTGKYPATVGLTNFLSGFEKGKLISAPYVHYLPLEEVTIARALQQAGYRTYHVGKWHLGNEPYWPENHGFEVNVAGCDWGASHGYFSPYRNPRLADGPAGEYLTDRLTDEAIALLRANGCSPFFMYMSHYAVHIPIQVPAKYQQKYEAKAKRLGLDQVDPFVVGEPFPCEHKKNQRVTRRVVQSDPAYAGMVENLDENVGRLLTALKEFGMEGNTIVFFTSDNGGLATAEGSPTCNLPLSEGKGWMFEGGTRVNLIVRCPEIIPPGITCDAPITSPDFYPTMLELAGLPLMPQQHQDGKSFYPFLRGLPTEANQPQFWHYPHYGNQGGTPTSAVRLGDYKLIEFFEDGRLALFNLASDIGETQDLASKNPAKVQELHEMLKDWRERVNAKIPERNPDWPYYLYEHYLRVAGPGSIDESGALCIRIQLSPQNPALYDIQLQDIVEFYLDKPLVVKVQGRVMRGMLKGGPRESLFIVHESTDQKTSLLNLLGTSPPNYLAIRAWKLPPEEKVLDYPAEYAIEIEIVEDPTI